MIVVDTNIIASLYLSTSESRRSEAVLRADPVWVAPVLWRSELRNVLASQVRQRSLRRPDAVQIAHAAEALLAGNEYGVPSDLVLALADESGCTAYDCEFVALAQGLGARLVTLDRALLRAFPELAQTPQEFAAGG